MGGKTNWLVVLAVAVVGLTLNAVAQEEGLYWMKAPVNFSLVLGGSYSDNRDGVEDAEGIDTEENFDAFFQPRVDFKIREAERSFLKFYYAPSLVWHSNPRDAEDGNPQRDTEVFHELGLNAAHELSPATKVKLADTLAYTADPKIDEGNATVRSNLTYLINRLSASILQQLSEEASIELAGASTMKRYEESGVADFYDEDVYEVDTTMRYRIMPQTHGIGHIGYGDFKYKTDPVTAFDRSSQIWTFDVGADHGLSPTLKILANGGYQMANTEDDRVEIDDSLYARLEIKQRTELVVMGLAGSYGLYGPYVQPYSIQKRTYVGANAECSLGGTENRNVVLTMAGQYGHGDYDEIANADGSILAAGGKDDLWLLALGSRFTLTKILSLQLGYQYENWESDVRASYARNTLSAMVRARF